MPQYSGHRITPTILSNRETIEILEQRVQALLHSMHERSMYTWMRNNRQDDEDNTTLRLLQRQIFLLQRRAIQDSLQLQPPTPPPVSRFITARTLYLNTLYCSQAGSLDNGCGELKCQVPVRTSKLFT